MPPKTKVIALVVALGSALGCGGRSVAPLGVIGERGVPEIGDSGVPPSQGCHLTITPSSLDFGNVTPGSVASQQVVLASDGTDPCVVRDVDLTPSTDAAFSLASGAVGNATLAPGMSLAVDVDFAPQTAGCYGGTLASPADRVGIALGGAQVVFMTGVGHSESSNCLEAPAALCDFVPPGQVCGSGKRSVSIVDNCQGVVTIESVIVDPPDAGFRVEGDTVRQSLSSGQTSSPIVIGFTSQGQPDTYVSATLIVQAVDNLRPLEAAFYTGVEISLAAALSHGAAQTETFTGQELVGGQLPLTGIPEPPRSTSRSMAIRCRRASGRITPSKMRSCSRATWRCSLPTGSASATG